MHDLTIYPSVNPDGPSRFCIHNCDKDGSLVSARLASAGYGVSSTRPIKITPDRYTDSSYFSDITTRLADYYALVHESRLLDPKIVILSSVHRAALYVAEALHAILLPLQVISFSRDLLEAQSSRTLGILGADHGSPLLWQWNKPSLPSDLPEAYMKILQKAEHLVVVRSTDPGHDCPIEGKIGKIYVNSTLKRLNPNLWETIRDAIEEPDTDTLRQWEWGLPDCTVATAAELWNNLNKKTDTFHLVQDGTVNLYRKIPGLWEAYLRHNEVLVRGITLNAYWTAHPGYERCAGLIPIHYYRFSLLDDIVRSYLDRYGRESTSPGSLCAFTNNVGSATDSEDVRRLLWETQLMDHCWFSVGLDCPGARCIDDRGKSIPLPYEKVSEWMMTSPYQSLRWKPLAIEDVTSLMQADTTSIQTS